MSLGLLPYNSLVNNATIVMMLWKKSVILSSPYHGFVLTLILQLHSFSFSVVQRWLEIRSYDSFQSMQSATQLLHLFCWNNITIIWHDLQKLMWEEIKKVYLNCSSGFESYLITYCLILPCILMCVVALRTSCCVNSSVISQVILLLQWGAFKWNKLSAL